MGISQNALARATDVPPRRINEIVLGKRGITADTAVRLAAALGTTERFWLGLQADYELSRAGRSAVTDQAAGDLIRVITSACEPTARCVLLCDLEQAPMSYALPATEHLGPTNA